MGWKLPWDAYKQLQKGKFALDLMDRGQPPQIWKEPDSDPGTGSQELVAKPPPATKPLPTSAPKTAPPEYQAPMGPPKAKAKQPSDGPRPPAPLYQASASAAAPAPEMPAAAHEAAVAQDDSAAPLAEPEPSIAKEEEKPATETKVEVKPPEDSETVKPPVKDEADGGGAPIASGEEATTGVKELVAPKDEKEQPKGRWRDKAPTASSSGQDTDARFEAFEKRFEEQKEKTYKAWKASGRNPGSSRPPSQSSDSQGEAAGRGRGRDPVRRQPTPRHRYLVWKTRQEGR